MSPHRLSRSPGSDQCPTDRRRPSARKRRYTGCPSGRGWLLGRFADLRGRRTAMLLTITLMAGGSFIIGILPTWEQVGWLAPILLLLARIGQGMSLGGEVSNASAYLAEIAPPSRRGRYSAFFYISTGTALLM